MIDSNFNNTEVPADLPEEQESQLNAKVFAARSKAKAKPQRREPVDLPSIIPMNVRILFGRMIVGKHAWQQDEEISVLH